MDDETRFILVVFIGGLAFISWLIYNSTTVVEEYNISDYPCAELEAGILSEDYYVRSKKNRWGHTDYDNAEIFIEYKRRCCNCEEIGKEMEVPEVLH